MPGGGPRYAIYFAPDPASALWRFGSACLAYDAALGLGCDALRVAGWSEEDWRRITEEPRRYGFHATLKAPFRLKDDVAEADLDQALDRFANRQDAFVIEGLQVRALSHFIALAPMGETARLSRLAADCVRDFDDLRAPLTEAEIERRRPAILTQRQRDYLARWGYPYVMEEFRFHMTLTGPLAADERVKTERELSLLYAGAVASGPVAIDSVALFRQDRPDARFRMIRRAPLLARRSAEAHR